MYRSLNFKLCQIIWRKLNLKKVTLILTGCIIFWIIRNAFRMSTSEEASFSSVTEKFNWIEFASFGSLMGLSALIGIYYGWIKGKQNTVSEYMFGGKTMAVFPIAMSLVTSHISGVTLLGIPAEIFEYGTQYAIMIPCAIAVVYVTNTFYLPVFYELQVTSLYEYLELRFSKSVREFTSLIFTLSVILHIPLVIYVPALAFHEVTGLSVHIVAPIICFLCIFYTTIGGLKAVVWTDAIQGVFTIGAMIAVTILGIINVGGFQNVYDANVKTERMELFNMNMSVFARNSLWTVSIGGFILNLTSLATNPGVTQRFISLPTMKKARNSMVVFLVGYSAMKILAVIIGMILSAKYYLCDPLKSKQIERSGQLLPFYVQDVAARFPGLTGIFISGLISAALSTMSAGLNTLAGTFYEDFVSKCLPKNTTEGTASFIMKIIVVIVGCICVILVHFIEKMGAILQLSVTLHGITHGSIFTAFALGIFFPWANAWGVFSGMLSSMVIMSWIISGTQVALFSNTLKFVTKETFTTDCPPNLTIADPPKFDGLTEITEGVYAHPDLNTLYAMSYWYYAVFGSIIGVTVGLVVSYFTGFTDLEKLDPALITPPMRTFMPAKSNLKRKSLSVHYESVLQGVNGISKRED